MLLIIVKKIAVYVCICKGIKDSDVREAGRTGLLTPYQLKTKFGLKQSDCCGRCAKNIREIVEIAVQGAAVSCPITADR
jgi:bacterioferritin-associated ferredoxin